MDSEAEEVTHVDIMRAAVAEQLFAVIASLRPDDGPKGQAWVLTTASTAMARAILAHVGPGGDAEELLTLAATQVREIVTKTQSTFFRDRLTTVPGKKAN